MDRPWIPENPVHDYEVIDKPRFIVQLKDGRIGYAQWRKELQDEIDAAHTRCAKAIAKHFSDPCTDKEHAHYTQ